jgi:hypothetical protein
MMRSGGRRGRGVIGFRETWNKMLLTGATNFKKKRCGLVFICCNIIRLFGVACKITMVRNALLSANGLVEMHVKRGFDPLTVVTRNFYVAY